RSQTRAGLPAIGPIEIPLNSIGVQRVLKAIWLGLRTAHSEIQAHTLEITESENKAGKALTPEEKASKTAHRSEINELKQYWNSIKKIVEGNALAEFMAAVLIRNVQEVRAEGFHSILVDTESTATMIQRLLIEIAIQQRLHLAIVDNPDQWEIQIHSPIPDLIRDAIQPIGTAFHGPETHRTGMGPDQLHYNAGIAGFGSSGLRNTHIYFMS
ncbi:hypothetical protein EBR96_06915, partial [bacterium]|nr:hypothetical protein [bacterium]